MTTQIPAYLTGALAINTAGLPQELLPMIERVRADLSLRKRGHPTKDNPTGWSRVEFWFQQGAWLYIPRGYALTTAPWLLQYLDVNDGRSSGRALPAWTRLGDKIVLGEKPHPPGQPMFVKELASGSTTSGIGGVGLAPTRSGKTICAIAAAVELGRYTLILVDSVALLRQWKKNIEEHIVYGDGQPIRCGVIRAERFETDAPFTVATIQTIANRNLTDDVRRTYGTILLDECQSAPCDTIWSALLRMDAQHVIGLTATPRRADGLEQAIHWLCGPTIAELERKMEADVVFLHWPYRKSQVKIIKVSKKTNKPYKATPRLTKFGRLDKNEAAKAMFADPDFCPWLAQHIATGIRDQRRVLVMVHLRQNVLDLEKACRNIGLNPGLYMGTMDEGAEKRAMQRNPVIATIKKAGKGIDFQPPPDMTILAAPVSDPEQIIGRGLQPQARWKPLLAHVVVGAKALVKQARRCLTHYRKRGFDVKNEPWNGEAA